MPRVYSSGVDITVIRLAGTVYLDWSNKSSDLGNCDDRRTYEPIIFPFFRDVETDSLHILGGDRMFGQIFHEGSRQPKGPTATMCCDHPKI